VSSYVDLESGNRGSFKRDATIATQRDEATKLLDTHRKQQEKRAKDQYTVPLVQRVSVSSTSPCRCRKISALTTWLNSSVTGRLLTNRPRTLLSLLPQERNVERQLAPDHGSDVRMVRAGDLAHYAVHSADTDGSVDIGDERRAANAGLRESIKRNGINQTLTLRVDADRGLAHIADGNHRAVMAASIDPDMLVPVRIVESRGNKRALPTAKPYDGRFNNPTSGAVEQGNARNTPKQELSVEDIYEQVKDAKLAQRSGNADTGTTVDEVLGHLTTRFAGANKRTIGKLIQDGNMVIVQDTSEIPHDAEQVEGSAGFYDGKRTYIVANQLDGKNVMGDLLNVAAHEIKHASDLGGGKQLKATMGNFIGQEANKRINDKIMAAVRANDPVAKAAYDAAHEGSRRDGKLDMATLSLELPAYYITAVRAANSEKGIHKRIANDIVSSVRTAFKGKGNADINLDDVAYLSTKLLQQAATTGEHLGTDKNPNLQLYVGPNANLSESERQNLEDAKGLLAQGFDEDTVRLATGWFKGPHDGKWRMEISDRGANFGQFNDIEKAAPFETRGQSMGEVFNHDELYKYYPDAKDINFVKREAIDDPGKRIHGWANPNINQIGVTPHAYNPSSVAVHELQHWIQEKEGWAKGGNASSVWEDLNPKQKEKFAKQALEKLRYERDGITELYSVLDKFRGWKKALNLQTALQQQAKLEDEIARSSQNEFMTDDAYSELENKLESHNEQVNALLDEFDQHLGKPLERYTPGVAEDFLNELRRPHGKPMQLREELKAQLVNIGEDMAAVQSGDSDTLRRLMGDSQTSHKLYESIAGEIEARDTQARMNLTDHERLTTKPFTSEKHNPEDVIVKFGKDGGEAMSALAYKPANLKKAIKNTYNPDNKVMKLMEAGFSGFGPLGRELGTLKEFADGEAAVRSHNAMNLFNQINDGITQIAKQWEASKKYKNLEQAQIAAHKMVNDELERIRELDSPASRKAALSQFTMKHPELRPLGEAADEVSQLTRVLIKQLIDSKNGQVTDEDRLLLNKMMNNDFAYTTRMYAAFQGEAGKDFSKARLKGYLKGKKDITKLAKMNELERQGYNDFKGAVNHIIENDIDIPDYEGLARMKLDQLQLLHDTWVVGDAGRNYAVAVESAVKNGVKRKDAEQIGRETLMQNLLDRKGDITEADKIGKAEDIVKSMVGLSDNNSGIASYYRNFAQDKSILERRTAMPDAVRKVLGEITDPATRFAVTIAKQGELAARTRLLLEIRDKGEGKWVVPAAKAGLPGNEKFTETLGGDSFGPLKGYRTTKEIKNAIGDQLEVFSTMSEALSMSHSNAMAMAQAIGRKTINTTAKLAGFQKLMSVVVSPYNAGLNLIGSGITLMANGVTDPRAIYGGLKVAAEVVLDTATGGKVKLSKEAEDAYRYGLLDSAQVQEIRRTPQQFVRNLITTQGKATSTGKKYGGRALRTGVEGFAMADAHAKIAAFQDRTKTLTKFYEAEGVSKTEDEIKREAADQMKDTNITYGRTGAAIRTAERVGLTTYAPYFASVYRSLAYNLAYGVKDIVRAGQAKTPKGKAIMLAAGVKRTGGAAAAMTVIPAAMKMIASSINGADDDKDNKMKKLMMADARFANSIYLGKDKDGTPLFARFSRIDPYGPLTDVVRIMMDDDTPQADKNKYAVQMLEDMLITNRVLPAAMSAFTEAVSDDKTSADKQTKLERIFPKGSIEAKRFIEALPGLDWNDSNAVMGVLDTFTPGIANLFDSKNVNVKDAKDPESKALADIITWSGGRLDRADPGLASYSAGKAIKDARKQGSNRQTEGLKAGMDHKELLSMFLDDAGHEYDAARRMGEVYDGMVNGLGMSPHEAAKQLRKDGATEGDISMLRRGRVDLEAGEWVKENSRILSKQAPKRSAERRGQELTDDEKRQIKEYLNSIEALGYKVRK
jgi:hypothetical protein